MQKRNNVFNIIIAGVGGQGLITLALIIAQAAKEAGFDIKTSELHGLSQREGSVKVEVRFGKKVYSPLVPQGKADLIICLESQEALSAAYYASGGTTFLINQYQSPIFGGGISEKEAVKNIKKISSNIRLLPATKVCREKLNNEMPAGVLLLGYAAKNSLIPLEPASIEKALKKVLPKKHWQTNLKALELA